MIIQKGNKILLDNPNDDLDKEVFQICKNHEAYYRSFCIFCDYNKDPEEFYSQSNQEKAINYFIMDIQENKYFDNQHFNAGISTYDQLLHKDKIANLKKQGYDPKDIAIQLGLYTQQDVKELIDRAVQENWQELQEFSVTIDFWEISQTKTFLNRAEQILENLNLHNSIIIYPSKKAIMIKLSQSNQQQVSRFLASSQTIDQQAVSLKSDTIQIQRKGSLPAEYSDAQVKRILNNLLKPTQLFPFCSEIVYFTDEYKDLQIIAQKFGKQQTPFNIYCNQQDIDKYYNMAGLSGGKVQQLFSKEKRQITHKLRAIITNNYIFKESQSNKFERFYTEINFPIDLEYELKDPKNINTSGCLQVIIQDDNGCYVEQKIIQINSNNDLHEASASLSQVTLNLTDLPKE